MRLPNKSGCGVWRQQDSATIRHLVAELPGARKLPGFETCQSFAHSAYTFGASSQCSVIHPCWRRENYFR